MKGGLTVIVSILFLSSLAYGNGEKTKSNGFDHAEYLQATSSGQQKAAPAVKGSLHFNPDQKTVEFLDAKVTPVLRINYDSIKSILYEQTSKPRYAEAILISPLFILSSSKKHFLTVQYTDDSGAAEAQTGKKVERVEEQ